MGFAMVLVYLVRHWFARRHYPFASWLACIVRSLRVLLFYRAHARLVGSAIYRDYLNHAHDDVFHHLSHRDYLARGLGLRQRLRCVQTHTRFEHDTFDDAYKRAVYRDGGLALWRHHADGHDFAIRLEMAARLCAEGDLTLAATCDGVCLHRLSFSWVNGDFAGVDAAVVPFIARNQGHRAEAAEAFAAFEQAFPQNSPSFFCAAALLGLAQALGIEQLAAVKAVHQSAWSPADAIHFANAYDRFWKTLGGVDGAGLGWRIALPFALRPLAETPAKHRKRAALRRARWHAIGESARLTLRRHLAPARAGLGAPVHAHAGALAPEA